MNIGIVGLGLIGGSLAKSIKARTGHTVWGIDLNQESMMLSRMCGAIDATLTKGEKFTVAKEIIDRTIHKNYHFWAINYYFYELLTGDTRFVDKYTAEEKANLDAYLASRIEKVDLPNKDVDFLREKILQMYANPVINYLKATE